jgi:type III secretion system-like peptide-binding chaperone
MDGGDMELAGDVERAWGRFRGRLADWIATVADDDCRLIELEVGTDADELGGAAPYVQLMGWGGDVVRAEVASNAHLDERFRLGDEAQERLVGLGWLRPTCEPGGEAEAGSADFHTDLEAREADRLAVMCVRALREVFGCPHPAFLGADGLEVDPDLERAPEARLWGPSRPDEEPEPLAELAESHEQLRILVDRALGVALEAPLRYDDDGSVVVVVGESAIFVRVETERPGIEFYAELVVDVTERDRAAGQVRSLNRHHPFARFTLEDDAIVMSYRICAVPFAATQLRVILGVLMDSLDDVARDVARLVGGRRFLEFVDEPVAHEPAPRREDRSSSLLGLLEMLREGSVRPRLVAALFDNDRHQIIAQLVRLRTGVDRTEEHDQELVLGQLRAALRFVADAAALRPVRRTVPSRPPRTRQLSLLPEPGDTLDSGAWVDDLEEST